MLRTCTSNIQHSHPFAHFRNAALEYVQPPAPADLAGYVQAQRIQRRLSSTPSMSVPSSLSSSVEPAITTSHDEARVGTGSDRSSNGGEDGGVGKEGGQNGALEPSGVDGDAKAKEGEQEDDPEEADDDIEVQDFASPRMTTDAIEGEMLFDLDEVG